MVGSRGASLLVPVIASCPPCSTCLLGVSGATVVAPLLSAPPKSARTDELRDAAVDDVDSVRDTVDTSDVTESHESIDVLEPRRCLGLAAGRGSSPAPSEQPGSCDRWLLSASSSSVEKNEKRLLLLLLLLALLPGSSSTPARIACALWYCRALPCGGVDVITLSLAALVLSSSSSVCQCLAC